MKLQNSAVTIWSGKNYVYLEWLKMTVIEKNEDEAQRKVVWRIWVFSPVVMQKYPFSMQTQTLHATSALPLKALKRNAKVVPLKFNQAVQLWGWWINFS